MRKKRKDARGFVPAIFLTSDTGQYVACRKAERKYDSMAHLRAEIMRPKHRECCLCTFFTMCNEYVIIKYTITSAIKEILIQSVFP